MKVQRIVAQRCAMSNVHAVDFIGKDFWYLTQTSQRALRENILGFVACVDQKKKGKHRRSPFVKENCAS